MLLARRKPHHVTRANFLDRPALALEPSRAGSDDQGLAERMRVPRGARARLEGDDSAADARGFGDLKDGIDAHRAGEPCLGAFARRPEPLRLISIVHSFVLFVRHRRCLSETRLEAAKSMPPWRRSGACA